MPTIATREAQATDIFNRLADLDIGDVQEAMRLLFRVRRLDTGYPDLLVKTSRADAALIVGSRDEAAECLSIAFQLRTTADYPTLQRLVLLLMLIGDRQKALATAREFAQTPGLLIDETSIRNVITAAMWAGDLDLLRDIAAREIEAKGVSMAQGNLDALQELDIIRHFPAHQMTISDVMRASQIKAVSQLCQNEDPELIVLNQYYFDPSKTNRRSLEHRIEEALAFYYKSNALDDSYWRGKIVSVVTQAPVHGGLGQGGAHVAA